MMKATYDADNDGVVDLAKDADTVDGKHFTDIQNDAQAKVDAHNSKTSVHGATFAATANRIIMRDANGRAKVAAPSASDDIARKDTVDNHAAVKADSLNLGHVKQGSYLSIDTDGVISADATSIRTDTSKPLRAEVSSSAPSSPANGRIWYDSSNHKFKGYANGAWV